MDPEHLQAARQGVARNHRILNLSGKHSIRFCRRSPSDQRMGSFFSCWSFRDVGKRQFDGDGRKDVIKSGVSGISAIGFNSLKVLTV